MPRTNIAAINASGTLFPWDTTGLEITMTAADVANQNETPAASKVLLIAYNSGGSSRTVTITSTADTATGRTGNVSSSIAAGDYWCWMLVKNGWQYDDSGTLKFRFGADHADVKFAIIKLVA